MNEALEISGIVIAAFGGGSAIVLGLTKWSGELMANTLLNRVRQNHERELEKLKTEYNKELELLRTDQQKVLKIHALQFEKEFSTYQTLWAAVLALRKEVEVLMPELDRIPKDSPWASIAPERMKKAAEAFDRAKNIALENRPFVNPSAYELCDRLFKVALKGILRIRLIIERCAQTGEGGGRIVDYEEMRTITNECHSIADELCVLIHARIGILYESNVEG